MFQIVSQEVRLSRDGDCVRGGTSTFLNGIKLNLKMLKSSFRSCDHYLIFRLNREVTGESCRFIPAKDSWKLKSTLF